MRLCYVLLSPTYGMHQYTADLANRMALAGHDVHLVTTARAPRGAYSASVQVHMPVRTRNSGFSVDALRPAGYRAVAAELRGLRPDLVHFTGPHLWNVPLLRRLRSWGVATLHSLHDLSPHSGTAYGRLLQLWNGAVTRHADHLLVHGACQREQLIRLGVEPERVTATPLLHLFCSPEALRREGDSRQVTCEPWALFFGRLEAYKGIADLLAATRLLPPDPPGPRVVLAGAGPLPKHWRGHLPERVELRNRFIDDDEAIDLFRRCGLVVLPYRDASQSALIGAAYYFGKPVIVTRTGALPEYVEQGVTGWVVEPRQPEQLAGALESALADPARLATMGKAGRAWYDQARATEWSTLERLIGSLASGCKLDQRGE